MNIVVIGHLVWDVIIRPDGSKYEGVGGIAYSLAALAAFSPLKSRIYPVCRLGKNLAPLITEAFAEFPAIDFSLIRIIDSPNEIHQLHYDGCGYRKERNLHLMKPLKSNFIDPPSRAKAFSIGYLGGKKHLRNNQVNLSVRPDAFLINYIGGDEFPPREIDRLKRRFNVPIFIDYHSLALGRDPENKRYFRRHPAWRHYISRANILQMNLFELRTLYPNTPDDDKLVMAAASNLLSYGPEAILITRENRPAVAVWKVNGKIHNALIAIPTIARPVDTTGCGDTFAAAFLISFLSGNDVPESCRLAAELAAAKAQFSGIGGFANFSRINFT